MLFRSEKIEEHREEAKEQREAATVQATDKDTVSISAEGQKVSSANPTPSEPVMDSNSTEPKTYTTDGSIVASGASEPTISVNIYSFLIYTIPDCFDYYIKSSRVSLFSLIFYQTI